MFFFWYKPFTDRELKTAINHQKNTAPREDTIHPQMIKKKLTPETLKYLLDIYNNPFVEGGKDPKDVLSYRPVAQTNILCKIFKKMTNKRLDWYLEKEKKNR